MEKEKRRPYPRKQSFRSTEIDQNNIKKIISDIEEKLEDSIKPERFEGLNSFERKLVHRHFDHNKEFQTRTYRSGNNFTLCVYPVGNIERFAKEKAQECLESGANVELPPMGSYERYLVHNALKDISGVQSESTGEGKERKIQLTSKQFGRGLKKIVKKIRLF
ncbi:MAG: R3H domain-containing nucleic acid-binding protein [bacterium]